MRISWPDCRNVRDLGGLPTTDGGTIRENALIRADSLDRLTDDGLLAVKRSGVSRIVDLRNIDEAALLPHPFAEDEIYRLIPLIDPRREPSRTRGAERTLATIYCDSLDRNARCIVGGLAAIADAPEGAVVVHCAVGKDRTGMIVALALSLAGVSDKVIAEDYALSGDCLREEFDDLIAGMDKGPDLDRLLERMSCRPETMQQMLTHAQATYGDIRGYVLQHGLGEERLARLRGRLRDG